MTIEKDILATRLAPTVGLSQITHGWSAKSQHATRLAPTVGVKWDQYLTLVLQFS